MVQSRGFEESGTATLVHLMGNMIRESLDAME